MNIEIPDGQSASSAVIIAGLTIRNLAHIFLFALLGIASFLFVNSLFAIKKKRDKIYIIYIALCSLIISLLYACLDEIHQIFVVGRTASFRDIGYDSIGFLITIFLSTIVKLIYNKTKNAEA